MFPCVLSFNTAALSSHVERVRKAFEATDRMIKSQIETLTTLLLILGLLLMILSSAPIRPSKPDMAEPAGGEGARSITAEQHKQTNTQGWWYWWWIAVRGHPARFFFLHTTVASVSSVHGWQQSPFFHSAQCEHCEANMTLTLHFLQRPCQSGVFACSWDSSANTDWLTKLKPPAKQLWIIPATPHRRRSSSHKFLRRPFRFEQMIIF